MSSDVPHTVYPFPAGVEGDWSDRGTPEEHAERVALIGHELARKLGWYENAGILRDASAALRDLGEARPTIMLDTRAEREARGLPALERLLWVAHGDHGQAVRVRRFLIGLYNGSTFPFDLTDLRSLDATLQEDCLAVLAMDMDGPRVEIHCRPDAAIIAEWAAEAWPESTGDPA